MANKKIIGGRRELIVKEKEGEKRGEGIKEENKKGEKAVERFERYKGKEEELCSVRFDGTSINNENALNVKSLVKSLKLESEKPLKKIFVFGDVHIPFHHINALLTTLYYGIEEVKPDEIIIIGDLFDFKGISSYLKDIKERDLAKELKTSAEILKGMLELFDQAKRIVYIEGNHEERLYNYIYKNASELSGLFSNPLELFKAIGYNFTNKIFYHSLRTSEYPYYPLVGKRLFAIHGHEYHKGAKHSVINIARNILEKAKKSIIFGHWHITQEYTSTAIDRELRTAWSVGCLSDLKPEWNPLNQWNHGFAIIYVYNDNFFTVMNKKIIEHKNRLIIV